MSVPDPPRDAAPPAPPERPKAWGGVFEQATDERVERFSESVSFDRRLADDGLQ